MSNASSGPQFVGRIEELRVLTAAIEDARIGVPSVVLVGGDAGIGKTTLLDEASRLSAVPMYLGRATPIGGDVIPLVPLADLARQIDRRAKGVLIDTPELAALRQWLEPLAVRLAPTVGFDNGALFAATLELLVRLGADDPVIVGFEDLHWADSVSWDLFQYLARNLIDEHVVLAATYRSNEVAADARQQLRLIELSRLPAARRIDLRGLHRNDIAQCVAALTGDRPAEALVDRIVARGQGNPFFTRELVTAHLNGDAIPIALSELISAEIAALDSDTRAVLAAIAAIGRDTTHQRLASIVDLGDAELERSLRTAIQTRVLRVDDSGAYQFRHPLIGEVAYADLLPPQRSRLHHRIAVALRESQTLRRERADLTGELALHLERSGDCDGAFTALLAAADSAEALSPGAAFAHLERALDMWDDLDTAHTEENRAGRLWQAAELATTTIGNHRAAELAMLALDAGDAPLGAAWGHERLGRYLWSSGQLEASRVHFEIAAQLLGDDNAPSSVAVFAGLGQAELMAGHDDLARQWCDRVFAAVPLPAANRAA